MPRQAQFYKFVGTTYQGHIDTHNEVAENVDYQFPAITAEADWIPPPIEGARYIRWQMERCPDTGRLHIQSYIQFDRDHKKTIAGVVKVFPGSWSVQRLTNEQCDAYASKEETRVRGPWQRGVMCQQQGQRSDLAEVKAAIEAGATSAQIRRDFPDLYSRCRTWCLEYIEDVRQTQVELINQFHGVNGAVSEWHRWIINVCHHHQPHDRAIIWVYDAVGNTGKSYLAAYLGDTCNAFLATGGKGGDIVHAYAKSNCSKVVVFDIPRDGQVGDYNTLESLKNGRAFSSKYDSRTMKFAKPHVIVFANFTPDRTKYSGDRIVMIDVYNGEWTPDSKRKALETHAI